MSNSWTCGDCGTAYPMSVTSCNRFFDDYLSLRGGTIESAISQAVERAIAPLVERANERLRPRYEWSKGAKLMVQVRWASTAADRARVRSLLTAGGQPDPLPQYFAPKPMPSGWAPRG